MQSRVKTALAIYIMLVKTFVPTMALMKLAKHFKKSERSAVFHKLPIMEKKWKTANINKMAILKTNPQLTLENGEATAFEIVAHTFDFVCNTLDPQENGEVVCETCPLTSICCEHMRGYDIADNFRKIAKECKSK